MKIFVIYYRDRWEDSSPGICGQVFTDKKQAEKYLKAEEKRYDCGEYYLAECELVSVSKESD